MQASCGSFQFYPILYFQLASLEYDNICIIHDIETKAIRKLNITTSTQGCALDWEWKAPRSELMDELNLSVERTFHFEI